MFYFKNINQITTPGQTLTYVISTYYYVLDVVTCLKRIQHKKSLHILKEGIIVPLLQFMHLIMAFTITVCNVA